MAIMHGLSIYEKLLSGLDGHFQYSRSWLHLGGNAAIGPF